jgi:hypothetical protein
LGVSRRLFPLNLEQKMVYFLKNSAFREPRRDLLREGGSRAYSSLLTLRFVIAPLVEYILKVEREHPDRQIAVLVPELVVKTLAAYFAPPPAARLLKLLLLVRGNQCVMVINIPWYL